MKICLARKLDFHISADGVTLGSVQDGLSALSVLSEVAFAKAEVQA